LCSGQPMFIPRNSHFAKLTVKANISKVTWNSKYILIILLIGNTYWYIAINFGILNVFKCVLEFASENTPKLLWNAECIQINFTYLEVSGIPHIFGYNSISKYDLYLYTLEIHIIWTYRHMWVRLESIILDYIWLRNSRLYLNILVFPYCNMSETYLDLQMFV